MSYRVIQCYTGVVGRTVIALAASDPRIDVVGVFVHHPEKAGRDTGELAGIGPTGVTATQDLDGLLEAGADCAIWAGPRDDAMVARILRAGVNVYALSGPYYSTDPGAGVIEEACQRGGVTFMGGGNIPGLISDVLPLFVSGFTGNITQVRAWQRNHVPDQPSAENLVGGCGFGRAIDLVEGKVDPLAQRWERALRQSAQMVADGLGVVLDDFGVSASRYAPAPTDLHLVNSGVTVRQGSVAGVQWQFDGVSAGQRFYQMNVEMTVALGLGVGWRDSVDDPNWRIEVDGSPDLIAEMTLPEPSGSGSGVLVLNAARAVNSVARIVEAPSGFHTVLDFPAPTGSGAGAR